MEPYLSIVIPVFNEKDTVFKVINKILSMDFVKEIIIVEDGSTDGTSDILKEAPLDKERVKLIFHEGNLGKGRSLRDGFKKISGKIIATQDADLEYNPDELKKLTLPILNGIAKVVYGSRFSEKKILRRLFFA